MASDEPPLLLMPYKFSFFPQIVVIHLHSPRTEMGNTGGAGRHEMGTLNPQKIRHQERRGQVRREQGGGIREREEGAGTIKKKGGKESERKYKYNSW